MACALNLGFEKLLGNIKANTCAVTRFAIGVHRPSVPNIFQGLNGLCNDVAARRAVNRGDKANAARAMLIHWVISMGGRQRLAFCFVIGGPQ